MGLLDHAAPVQLLTVIGAVALLTCIASLTAMHFLPTGFHPIRDPVSNYAISRYGLGYHIQAFASGICGVCLLVILDESDIELPTGGMLALGSYAVSRLLIIAFPTDIPPRCTRTGTVHLILAVFTFGGIAGATALLTRPLIGSPTWSSVGAALQAAAVLTVASTMASLVVVAIAPLRLIFSLVERGIYVGAILWLGIVFGMMLLSLET